MSKTKKIISLLLTVVLVMTMATVAIVSSSALADGEIHVVAGAAELCGSAWDPADTNNQMTWNADKGIYEKIYTNVAAGTYEFKVTTNYAWDNGDFNLDGDAMYGGANAVANVDVDGSTVIIGFDGSKALLEITAGSDEPVVTEPAATGDEPVVTEPVVTEPVAGDTITVYFTNNWMFTTQNIYFWGTGADPEWPGVAMTLVDTNENGEDIYAAEIPASATGIIFNGAHDQDPSVIRQTVDILDFADGMGFYCAEEVDGKITVGTYEYVTPVVTDPVVTEPVVTEPKETEPVVTEPKETEPVVTEPKETEPVVTEPKETEPAVTEKGVELNGTLYAVTAGDTITYTVELTAAELFENVQAVVTYDADKLELVRKGDDEVYEEEIACPDLGDAIFNADVAGVVKFNASKVKGYNFKDGGVLVTLDFIVKDNAKSTIDLVIEEMTIKGDGTQSYFTNGQAVITDGITVAETLIVPPQPTTPDVDPTTPDVDPTTPDVDPTTPDVDPTTPDVDPTTPDVKPTTPDVKPTAPVNTDATSVTDGTVDKDDNTVDTGATAYIYIALAIVAMAAAAVVVLRKKANG